MGAATTEERGGAVRSAGAAFRYREFRLFWSGAVASNIGTWMQNITVPYVLLKLTGSGVWVGLAVVAQILPSIVLNPISGSLADRFSRRELLRVSNTVQGLAAFGLCGLWVSGGRSPGLILLLVAVGGTASMATQPAWQAMVTDLVPPEHMLNAITLNSAQANTARAVGPALGGVIIGTLGPAWAFAFNGVSFVAVLVMLSMLRPPARRVARPEGRILEQYREAASYARHHTGLLTAYALTAVVCGLGYPVFQMTALFADRVYHAGPGRYGLLSASYGAGAVIGALLLNVFGAHRARGQVMSAVLVVHALAVVGFGLARSFWIGAPLLAIVGAGSLCAVATLNTSIQTAAPERLRGRVLALWILSYTASYPLGSLLQGWLADRIGPGPTVATAGLVMCVAAGVLLVRRDLAHSLDGRSDVVVVDPVPASG